MMRSITPATDLLRMIRLFVATARHLNDRRAWNSDWVAALGKVEAEIAGAVKAQHYQRKSATRNLVGKVADTGGFTSVVSSSASVRPRASRRPRASTKPS